jgi:hypothetical protein
MRTSDDINVGGSKEYLERLKKRRPKVARGSRSKSERQTEAETAEIDRTIARTERAIERAPRPGREEPFRSDESQEDVLAEYHEEDKASARRDYEETKQRRRSIRRGVAGKLRLTRASPGAAFDALKSRN